MAEGKKKNRIVIVVVAILVVVIIGLIAKNSIAEGIIADKINEAKGSLPNQVELSFDGVSCTGLGISTCTISGIKIDENGHFIKIGSVSFTENSSLISFGMKNMSKPMSEAEGSMQIALSIKGIEFSDGKSSLLPPINIEKDIEATLKNGMPTYLKINNHHITSSFIDANIKGEIKNIKFQDAIPLDATISHLDISAKNKDLASLLSIVPKEFLDDATRGYVVALLEGKENFFLQPALKFEHPMAEQFMLLANRFTSKQNVNLTIENKSGISLSSLMGNLSAVKDNESEVFRVLDQNFKLGMK